MTPPFVQATLLQDTPLMESNRLRTFLRSFFNRYDINRDGHIDATELRLLLKDLNEPMSQDRFKEVMADMDKDKNGVIGELDACLT
jgi:Ca2+-binding EF-hand superfamily protein